MTARVVEEPVDVASTVVDVALPKLQQQTAVPFAEMTATAKETSAMLMVPVREISNEENLENILKAGLENRKRQPKQEEKLPDLQAWDELCDRIDARRAAYQAIHGCPEPMTEEEIDAICFEDRRPGRYRK